MTNKELLLRLVDTVDWAMNVVEDPSINTAMRYVDIMETANRIVNEDTIDIYYNYREGNCKYITVELGFDSLSINQIFDLVDWIITWYR